MVGLYVWASRWTCQVTDCSLTWLCAVSADTCLMLYPIFRSNLSNLTNWLMPPPENIWKKPVRRIELGVWLKDGAVWVIIIIIIIIHKTSLKRGSYPSYVVMEMLAGSPKEYVYYRKFGVFVILSISKVLPVYTSVHSREKQEDSQTVFCASNYSIPINRHVTFNNISKLHRCWRRAFRVAMRGLDKSLKCCLFFKDGWTWST